MLATFVAAGTLLAAPALADTLREPPLQLSSELSLTNIPNAIGPETSSTGKVYPPAFVLTPPASTTLREDEPRISTIDLTRPANDLLQRLRNGFSMPDLHGALVANRQAWYLNNPAYIKRVVERSKRYLYHIVSELEERGMPTELALLPIVESSYNPLAASHAKALGMWQFIPSTGKSYRLEQNWWMDERRDIIASTKAALDYLQYIYEMHGDWHLALASYNWGEGAVGRAIAKNRAKGLPTDYASLNMPDETRYYVPKLQAIKNILAQPELYGIKLAPIPNRPYFGTVEKPGDLDVTLAAKLAEIPVDEFIALNPAYQRPIIPGNSRTPLVLPADKVQTFIENLGNHEAQDKPLSAWKTHSLGKGEKLDAVATRYGTSLARLKQLNGITARTKVGPGFTLLVPGKDAPSDSQFAALDAKLPNAPSAGPSTAPVCSKDKKGRKVCKPAPAANTKTSKAAGKTSSTTAKADGKKAKGSAGAQKNTAKTGKPSKPEKNSSKSASKAPAKPAAKNKN
ncbi:MAG: transglycosylase SLT domain-containing protein [Rhodocyclaceae bacterium]|nr:transglycosylase SLT domain-containing protein [Rhodocyclaceae bacterium]